MTSPRELWNRYAGQPTRIVVGLMSGTSVDGIDVAAVRVGERPGCELLAFETFPWPETERRLLLAAAAGDADPERVARLHFRVGERFGDAAHTLLERLGLKADAAGSHGQTISHVPIPSATLGAGTLQIGAAAPIAQRLGCLTVSDFRTADVSLGGQGAPLVPIVDWILFRSDRESRALQNIGGIGNVAYLPRAGDSAAVTGFDTGPGNLLLDLAARWASGGEETMDVDGRRAARGRPDFMIVERLLSLSALALAPPRSFGREEFGDALFHEILQWKDWKPAPDDLCATVTEFAARSIAEAYARWLPDSPARVYVAGGGAHNPTMMRWLAAHLSPATVETQSVLGIDSDAKEAIAFALLADELLMGRTTGLPQVTGAARPAFLGSVTAP